MSNTTLPPAGHSHSVTQDNSALFFLDFLGRYAVDRCGAEDSLLTSMASTVCILPVWIWLSSFCLSLVKVELYWLLARYSLSLLTLLQLVFLLVYDTPPPVLGCGPSQSFPSPQVALSSYAYAIFLSHRHLRSVDHTGDPGKFIASKGSSYQQPETEWLDVFMIVQYLLVVHSVLWVGFASPASALAGGAVGTLPAVALHQVVFVNATQQQGWLLRVAQWLETKIGVDTFNTLFVAVDSVEEVTALNMCVFSIRRAE